MSARNSSSVASLEAAVALRVRLLRSISASVSLTVAPLAGSAALQMSEREENRYMAIRFIVNSDFTALSGKEDAGCRIQDTGYKI